MRGKPKAKRIWPWSAMAIVLVAALFFFEWLGSEQPQRVIEIEVQPGIRPETDGASGKD
ncbi:MAG: hypothetical protein WA793_06855 [Sphingorhabdus sp.]|uniref:hypothetical protein n=1 Tax=Sphingorhabdus sp. TaxID=1902408 RepID=UPI003C9DE493